MPSRVQPAANLAIEERAEHPGCCIEGFRDLPFAVHGFLRSLGGGLVFGGGRDGLPEIIRDRTNLLHRPPQAFNGLRGDSLGGAGIVEVKEAAFDIR
jgi:hypothetical protein